MPNFGEPGYIEATGSGIRLVDKEIDLLVNRANRIPTQGGKYFRVVNPRTDTWKESTVGNTLSLPMVTSDSVKSPRSQPAIGFTKELTVVTYGLVAELLRDMAEDDLQGKARFMLSGLMDSGKRRLEYAFASIFNNAFTGTAGADSAALCADSHANEHLRGGTWDNLETAGALTGARFATARLNLRKRTDERGFPMPIMTKFLTVPPDLEQKADEIRLSVDKPETALNDINVWNRQFEVDVYDWLTSTTAWFLWGDLDTSQRGGLVYAEKAPINIAAEEKDTVDIIDSRRLRMRFAVGFTTEKNVQGNAGA